MILRNLWEIKNLNFDLEILFFKHLCCLKKVHMCIYKYMYLFFYLVISVLNNFLNLTLSFMNSLQRHGKFNMHTLSIYFAFNYNSLNAL